MIITGPGIHMHSFCNACPRTEVSSVIYRVYEWLTGRQITILPAHICFMLTEQDLKDSPGKLSDCTRWSIDISSLVKTRAESGPVTDRTRSPAESTGILGLTFHISTDDLSGIREFLPEIRELGNIAHLYLHCGDSREETGQGLPVRVAIGKSGRDEITECIRTLARQGVDPCDINEATIESCLTFQYTPDLVIKTGGDHLTDFLIWQSVYSELFFSDTNWKYFRKIDFLRALRDYQARVRRFGR